MAIELILRNAKLEGAGPDDPLVDIGIETGKIAAIEPALTAEA